MSDDEWWTPPKREESAERDGKVSWLLLIIAISITAGLAIEMAIQWQKVRPAPVELIDD